MYPAQCAGGTSLRWESGDARADRGCSVARIELVVASWGDSRTEVRPMLEDFGLPASDDAIVLDPIPDLVASRQRQVGSQGRSRVQAIARQPQPCKEWLAPHLPHHLSTPGMRTQNQPAARRETETQSRMPPHRRRGCAQQGRSRGPGLGSQEPTRSALGQLSCNGRIWAAIAATDHSHFGASHGATPGLAPTRDDEPSSLVR